MQPLEGSLPSFLGEIQARCRENAAKPSPEIEDSEAMRLRIDCDARRRAARSSSVVWDGFAGASVEAYRTQQGTRAGKAAAEEVCKNGFRDSLALFGPDTGVGKTYLLAALANEAVSAGKRAVVANALEIITLISDARRAWDESEADAIMRFAQADFFGIDDLGKELFASGDAALRIMYQIVDARFNSGRRLWITSNFSFTELGSRYEARKDDFAVYFMDRIKGMIPAPRWVEMRGRSLRGRL